MTKTRRTKALLVTGVLAAASLLAFGRPLGWKMNPDRAFRSVTGHRLPPGVRATAHASEMNDNLFRTTHYWLLSATPETFRRVARGADVASGDLGNAREAVPDMRAMFGSPLTDADIAYAVPTSARGRDGWLCVFKGETTALFVY